MCQNHVGHQQPKCRYLTKGNSIGLQEPTPTSGAIRNSQVHPKHGTPNKLRPPSLPQEKHNEASGNPFLSSSLSDVSLISNHHLMPRTPFPNCARSGPRHNHGLDHGVGHWHLLLHAHIHRDPDIMNHPLGHHLHLFCRFRDGFGASWGGRHVKYKGGLKVRSNPWCPIAFDRRRLRFAGPREVGAAVGLPIFIPLVLPVIKAADLGRAPTPYGPHGAAEVLKAEKKRA